MRLKLKELRLRQGWTIDQMADVSGLSRGFISQLENAKRQPGPETLITLSLALGAPMASLIEDEGLGEDLPALIEDVMKLEPEGLSAVRTIVHSMLPHGAARLKSGDLPGPASKARPKLLR